MRRARPLFAALVAIVLPLGGGCAYFNTLYNAQGKFEEAQDLKRRADPERPKITTQEERLYDEAFEKAARVVKFYPDSKWVDDALLLMGKSAFEGGDYARAERKFDEILQFYPESNLVTETLLWKGRNHIATREYAQGVEALTAASARGKKKFKADIRYFLGVVSEENGEEQEALAAYLDVVKKYRKSEWFADAGLRAGAIAERNGDWDTAISTYERVWKKARLPEDRFRGGMRKGDAQRAVGDWNGAEKTYGHLGRGATNEDDRALALLHVGKAVAGAGFRDDAIAVYQQVIAKYPRREASAEAQYEIAWIHDQEGDLAGAVEQYDLVKEQGTGFPAWQRSSERMAELQRVIDLRAELAAENVEDTERKRFLLAEQLLEAVGDIDGALAEYASLARDADGTEWGSRARYAEAWVLENRLDAPDSANVLLFRLANEDPRTEVGKAARRRFGYAVWDVETIEERVEFVRPESESAEPQDIVLERVQPADLPLPPGVSEVKAWVRVAIAEDGTAESAKVVKSGGEEFDAAALEAARASRFLRPADGGPPITVVQYSWPLAAPAPTPTGADDEPSAAERDEMLEAKGSLPPNASLPPGTPPATSLPSGAGVAAGLGAAALADSLGTVADSTVADSTAAPPEAQPTPQGFRGRNIDSSTAD